VAGPGGAEAVADRDPYGAPSAPLLLGKVTASRRSSWPVTARGTAFRRTASTTAQYWALKQAGVNSVVAIAAVGAIAPWLPPGAVAVPTDLIDYTSAASTPIPTASMPS